MIPLNQTIRTTTKSLLCALLLVICLLTAGLVIARVQAAPHEAENALQTESEADPANESHPTEGTDLAGEEESSAERPGSSDQHNSTGDDILVRIPR